MSQTALGALIYCLYLILKTAAVLKKSQKLTCRQTFLFSVNCLKSKIHDFNHLLFVFAMMDIYFLKAGYLSFSKSSILQHDIRQVALILSEWQLQFNLALPARTICDFANSINLVAFFKSRYFCFWTGGQGRTILGLGGEG